MVNIEYLHLLTPSLPRVGDMNQCESEGPAERARPQLPANPSVDPAFINSLTSLFQKVSKQRVVAVMHTCTNRASDSALWFEIISTGGMCRCVPFESAHFK